MKPKQIVIISGKGGTGKTVLAAAFTTLAQNRVTADCDVDAANLHLLLKPRIRATYLLRCGTTAWINPEICIGCATCVDICRFGAAQGHGSIDSIACEGCGFCKWVCPAGAIEMKEQVSGDWYVSESRFGRFVHGRLGIAEENSGKMVDAIRQRAVEEAGKSRTEWIIVDGSPGIGCPVIASLTGSDYALVVTEPTRAGIHDADRVMSVAKNFKIPVGVIVNKYDLNPEMTLEIEKFCTSRGVQMLGKIKFHESVVTAMIEGKTVLEYSDQTLRNEIVDIWNRIQSAVTQQSEKINQL